jgi:hypothetical protein
MAQDLLGISLEAFKLQLYKFNLGALKQTLELIYEAKQSKYGYLHIDNLERKETAIEAELNRRGIANAKHSPREYEDFNKMRFKNFKKKRIF